LNIAGVDLRLLVLFDALMAEGSVSRAAVKAGLSQPAASNALNRLRDVLGDKLFVRTAVGMTPTATALRISSPVREALSLLQQALEPEAFDPTTSRHMFRLAVSDHASIVFLPRLVSRLKEIAPGVQLDLRPKSNSQVQSILDAAEVDAAIGVIPPAPQRFRRMHLFQDEYIVVMRKAHPLSRQALSLQQYAAAKHLAIRPAASLSSGVDMLLGRSRVHRFIELTVTQFLAVSDVLRRSDLIATVLRAIVKSLDMDDLQTFPLPLRDRHVDVSAVWTRIAGEHAAHKWLRQQLEQVGSEIG
jgi:DNA-binding transcriptional LysR family regulator